MKTSLRLLLSGSGVITHRLNGKRACMIKYKICPGKHYYVVTLRNALSYLDALWQGVGKLDNNPCKKISGFIFWIYKTYGRAKNKFREIEKG